LLLLRQLSLLSLKRQGRGLHQNGA